MRRFRNPVYAIESLERKLSPSGIVAAPVAAQVYVPSTTPVGTYPIDPAASTSNGTAGIDPPPPSGPADPAPPPSPDPDIPPNTTGGPPLPC